MVVIRMMRENRFFLTIGKVLKDQLIEPFILLVRRPRLKEESDLPQVPQH